MPFESISGFWNRALAWGTCMRPRALCQGIGSAPETADVRSHDSLEATFSRRGSLLSWDRQRCQGGTEQGLLALGRQKVWQEIPAGTGLAA